MSANSNIDAVIGRALRDGAFRNQVLGNPESIAREYSLSAGELAALKSVSQDAADEFFSKVAAGKGGSHWCTESPCCRDSY